MVGAMGRKRSGTAWRGDGIMREGKGGEVVGEAGRVWRSLALG